MRERNFAYPCQDCCYRQLQSRDREGVGSGQLNLDVPPRIEPRPYQIS